MSSGICIIYFCLFQVGKESLKIIFLSFYLCTIDTHSSVVTNIVFLSQNLCRGGTEKLRFYNYLVKTVQPPEVVRIRQ